MEIKPQTCEVDTDWDSDSGAEVAQGAGLSGGGYVQRVFTNSKNREWTGGWGRWMVVGGG